MCCANGVGSVLVQDANGTLIFEGDPINLQNFTLIPMRFQQVQLLDQLGNAHHLVVLKEHQDLVFT